MPTPQELNIPDKLDSILATKQAIREAIVSKGTDVPEGTTFRQYADLIAGISTGLSDDALALADATPEDVTAGKTFYAGDRELKTGSLSVTVNRSAIYAEYNNQRSVYLPASTNYIIIFFGYYSGNIYYYATYKRDVSNKMAREYSDTNDNHFSVVVTQQSDGRILVKTQWTNSYPTSITGYIIYV